MRCLKRGRARLGSVQADRGWAGKEGKKGGLGQRKHPGSQRYGGDAGKEYDERRGYGDLGHNVRGHTKGAVGVLAVGMAMGKFYGGCGHDQYNAQERQEYLPGAACGRTGTA